jgi:hypothetical protein
MSISPRFRELVRRFLMRFYDNDLLSPDRDQLPGLASVLGLLAVPGIFVPFSMMLMFSDLGNAPLYVRDQMSLGGKWLFVTLSLTAVGLVTVLEWDALFPDRRDYQVLCPLPLPLRTIFAAKICSLVLFVAVFLAAVTSLTPILFPLVVFGSAPFSNVVWFGACHLMTVMAACLFTFLAVISVQGLFLNLLPYRWFQKFSPWLQLAALVALLVELLTSSQIYGRLNHQQLHNHWSVYWSPPMWFLGLNQYALGWDKPVYRELAGTALAALAGAALLAFCSYALAYKRHVRRCLEAAEMDAGSQGRLRRALSGLLVRLAVRRPVERAVFQFIMLTVGRSRKHRLYFSGYAALALAATFEVLAAVLSGKNHAWLFRPSQPLAWIPLVLLFVMLPGLRHAYAIPADLHANWMFRLAEPRDLSRVERAVRRATLVLAVVPICFGLLPVYVWLWGPRNALVHLAFVLSVALIARELLLFRLQKIPFTCSYVPGQANIKMAWALYLFSFITLVSTLAALEMSVLSRPWLLAAPAAALAGLCSARAFLARRETEPLLFEDPPYPAVQELGLSD